MPNLSNGENTFGDNRTFMRGEAIPLDPASRTNNTKFTRKTGFYKVNESTEKCPADSRSKKGKIRRFFNRKSASKLVVSSPKEALALGRVVRRHSSTEAAYVIELCKQDKGTFGFNIRKGYEKRKDGIFVCKIVDKKTEKFLSGLLHVGDEILEVNGSNINEKSLAYIQKLIKNVDKLQLTILPYSAGKE